MIKKIFLVAICSLFLQSCMVSVKHDYQNLSRSLVFRNDQKWLINSTYTDLGSEERERLNNRIFETFQDLSGHHATKIIDAQQQNLLPHKIPFAPSFEDLEVLKNNAEFDFLVNSYTKIVSDQIANIETSLPLQYSKNEAFAIIEVYDLKTLKRIYFQKASSQTEMEARKTYPQYSGQELYENKEKGSDSGPFFSYSAQQLSVKNMKKILKDINKNAVK